MEMAKNRNIQNIIPLGAAGTGGRDRAAKFWEEMNKDKINQNSLEFVRSSIFVLCLDENNDNINNDLNQMEKDGMEILYGFGPKNNGINRWFDSTIQLIVSKNGCCGTCIEHSIAEGIVHIKMTEEAMRYANNNFDLINKQQNQNFENNLSIIEPKPLSWVVSEKANLLLEEQIVEFEKLTNDLQLNLLQFKEFGKIAIKGWGVSPDGFMQLCMQLAHFKLHGYLVNSYESATMRRFRFGRVDNIRAATPEALNWVKAMCNQNEGKNLNGNGIDNHLCALEVLSREEFGLENLPEIFRDEIWKEMIRFPLSTSQVSTSPEFINCYLYYGPVVNDGYGCAYNIQLNNLIFAISTWKSDKRTNGISFRLNLIESLKEMKELLEFNE
uniref:Choline O-acetyltransferase n=1 Tax=Meloidogyne hapla TaxID=6305 RepID=A0A1I8B1B2_MELHA